MGVKRLPKDECDRSQHWGSVKSHGGKSASKSLGNRWESEISYESVFQIVTDILEISKVSARWVPCLLSDDHKQHRLEISQRHFNRFQQEGEDFLIRIITCNETWVHHYTPQSKQVSMEWWKRKKQSVRSAILFHVNARPHTANTARGNAGTSVI